MPDETLRMRAVVVDEGTGPMRSLGNAMRSFLREGTLPEMGRDFKKLHDNIVPVRRELKDALTPALVSFGITSGGVAGSLIGLSRHLGDVAHKSVELGDLSKELGLSRQKLLEWQAVGSRLGIEQPIAGVDKFTRSMLEMRKETAAGHAVIQQLYLHHLPSLADELFKAARAHDYARGLDLVLEALKRLTESGDFEEAGRLAELMFGDRAFGRMAEFSKKLAEIGPITEADRKAAEAYAHAWDRVTAAWERFQHKVETPLLRGGAGGLEQMNKQIDAGNWWKVLLGGVAPWTGAFWGDNAVQMQIPHDADKGVGRRRQRLEQIEKLLERQPGRTDLIQERERYKREIGELEAAGKRGPDQPKAHDAAKAWWDKLLDIFHRSGLEALDAEAARAGAVQGMGGGSGASGGFVGGPRGSRLFMPGGGARGASLSVGDQGAMGMPAGGGMTRGDRNNNPGNIKFGDFARAHGATHADDRGFAVFPSWDHGVGAQSALLSERYEGMTPRQIAGKYAEGSADWLNTVTRRLGIDADKPVSFRDPAFLKRFQQAIWGAEGTGQGGMHHPFLGTPLGGANFMHGQFGGPGQNQTRVTTAGGHSFTVNAAAATYFKGFVEDLEKAGAPIHSIGGFNIRNIAGSGRLSQHAYGNAIDIDQHSRNVVSRAFGQWAMQNPDAWRNAMRRWGIISGGDWRSPDFGHFEWGGPGRDRIDRALAAGTANKFEGSASIKVDVNAPRGTAVRANADGMFKNVELNRGEQMVPAPDFSGAP